jgi:hypothetical protein
MNTSTTPRPLRTRAKQSALAFLLTTAGLIGLLAWPAGAATTTAPVVRTSPRLSVSTVAVGNTVAATPPTFHGPVTRIDYAWEYCSIRTGSALTCSETGVPGTRYTPTLASTGGMTLDKWGSATYYVRVRAVAYNGHVASAPTRSALTRVVPGVARGALDIVEWWSESVFAVYGIAAADGVDGAIPYRLRAISPTGALVATHYGQTGLFRTDYRSAWPNTGNWGGFNVALSNANPARTLCLDVGTSYVPVTCRHLPPPPPPTMRGAL